jgi:hypothetical protein
MEIHQHRVINEKSDVDCRIQAMTDFMRLSLFVSLPLQEQDRQRRQLRAMREYSSILAERIEAF